MPVFLGYVGENMLDGCAVGNVFASPSAKYVEMIEACDNGAGVLCVFGNYGGDKMNLSIAREAAELEGIRTKPSWYAMMWQAAHPKVLKSAEEWQAWCTRSKLPALPLLRCGALMR